MNEFLDKRRCLVFRSTASETNDSSAAHKRSPAVPISVVNNKKFQSNQHVSVTNSKIDAVSPSYASGNLSLSDKIFNKDSVGKTFCYDIGPVTVHFYGLERGLMSVGRLNGKLMLSFSDPRHATPLVAALNQPLSTKPSIGSDLASSSKGNLIPHVSTALFPSVGGGLFSTPGATAPGAPPTNYFHTEMHQHTHMHQYQPFLSPLLNAAAAAGLPGLPGMVSTFFHILMPTCMHDFGFFSRSVFHHRSAVFPVFP